jgi:hypothetical protein
MRASYTMLAEIASLWSDAVTDTRRDVLPLTADLTTAELAEALGLVSLDRDVRDYLLRAIRAR